MKKITTKPIFSLYASLFGNPKGGISTKEMLEKGEGKMYLIDIGTKKKPKIKWIKLDLHKK